MEGQKCVIRTPGSVRLVFWIQHCNETMKIWEFCHSNHLLIIFDFSFLCEKPIILKYKVLYVCPSQFLLIGCWVWRHVGTSSNPHEVERRWGGGGVRIWRNINSVHYLWNTPHASHWPQLYEEFIFCRIVKVTQADPTVSHVLWDSWEIQILSV